LPGAIASLEVLAALIFTTILAEIFIASPVAGLRLRSELGFDGKSFSMPGSGKDEVFLFWGVGSSFGVARTVDTVLWKNPDFFHEPT
jgi:hypothetical protein